MGGLGNSGGFQGFQFEMSRVGFRSTCNFHNVNLVLPEPQPLPPPR